MLELVEQVQFPAPAGIVVNMMPVVPGDPDSVPGFLRGYCALMKGQFEGNQVAYLTVHESLVAPGQTQRRPGIHTEGTMSLSWGGGGWGGGAPAPVPDPDPKTPRGPRAKKAPAKKTTKKAPAKKLSGIFMASSDGRCRAWDLTTWDVDSHGAVRDPSRLVNPVTMEPSTMYWMTDRTPHESLPSLVPHYRQFYRLVAQDIGIWFRRHSTPNPLGVQPQCPVSDEDKFAKEER